MLFVVEYLPTGDAHIRMLAWLCRLQDVLPLAVFKKGKDREAASEAQLSL